VTIPLATLVERVRLHYDDGCFACGRNNPLGLHLDGFAEHDGLVSASFRPRPDYRGAGTVLHGGVAATALDEIMVWAGIVSLRLLTVTVTMELRYRRPIDVSEELVAAARVIDRSGRRLRVTGSITVGAEVRVEGSGLYLVSADLAAIGLLDGSDGDHAGMEMGDITELSQ
jgi:acyl-coenzyme A thioesterase PaaI-like protein